MTLIYSEKTSWPPRKYNRKVRMEQYVMRGKAIPVFKGVISYNQTVAIIRKTYRHGIWVRVMKEDSSILVGEFIDTYHAVGPFRTWEAAYAALQLML